MLNSIFGTGYLRFIVAFCIPLLSWLFLGKKIIKFFRKWQKGHDTVREYLEHKGTKDGVPTCGGIPMYVFMMLSFAICCSGLDIEFGIGITLISVFFLLGFFDDYMKIFVNNTKGLSGKFKFGTECLVSVIFVTALSHSLKYTNAFSVFVPIFNVDLDFGYWYIPFAIFIISGSANAFNLTDGLDGLVSFVTMPILIALFLVGLFITDFSIMREQLIDVLTYISALLGTIVGFLYFNKYPAKIFMGDSGSLMIGASVAVIATLLKHELILGIMCIIPIIETVSVIIQVGSFKLYKRRVFLMAPIHHHFEKKGYSETKVVKIFSLVSFVFSMLGFLILLMK